MPICFFRIPAKELLEQGMDGISPRWLLLGEDKVIPSYKFVFDLLSFAVSCDFRGEEHRRGSAVT